MGNTLEEVLSDNKQYYNCPSCNERVWGYGAFVGAKCFNVWSYDTSLPSTKSIMFTTIIPHSNTPR